MGLSDAVKTRGTKRSVSVFFWLFKAYKGKWEDFTAWHKTHVCFVDHQMSHAALAVLASDFQECVFVCQDNGGDFGDQRNLIMGGYKDGKFSIMKEHFGLKTLCSFHAFIKGCVPISPAKMLDRGVMTIHQIHQDNCSYIMPLRLGRLSLPILPMILGEDGARLSKRHGATSVADHRKRGYLAEALLNFLALLGWSPGNDQELLTKNEMIAKFSLDRVNKTSARFDNTKLDWMNGQYIMRMKTDEISERLRPFLEDAHVDFDSLNKVWLHKLIDLYHERLKTLQEFTEKTYFFFSDNIQFNDKAVKKFLQKEAVSGSEQIDEILEDVRAELSSLEDFSVHSLENCLRLLIEKHNIGFAKLAQPIRVAISGDSVSAGIFETLELLGKEKTLNRIQYAIKTFCAQKST